MLAAEGAEVGNGAVDEGGGEVAALDGVGGWLVKKFLVVGANQGPEVCRKFTVVGGDEEVVDELLPAVRYVSNFGGICVCLPFDNSGK